MVLLYFIWDKWTRISFSLLFLLSRNGNSWQRESVYVFVCVRERVIFSMVSAFVASFSNQKFGQPPSKNTQSTPMLKWYEIFRCAHTTPRHIHTKGSNSFWFNSFDSAYSYVINWKTECMRVFVWTHFHSINDGGHPLHTPLTAV